MTLKEELEILRGEPIVEFSGDPMDIPCIETSDPERLCKRPVVSVCMITYNHEKYIRQAIEGVMMQKTDFEFELIIGEDCSSDRTREICFEYQKRHPEKIRLLWSEHNVSSRRNGDRVSCRCRGEFIAFCEGDDYWTDPLKLQKQVDAMRQNPNAGICFCGSRKYFDDSGKLEVIDEERLPMGTVCGHELMKVFVLGVQNASRIFSHYDMNTVSFLYRRAAYRRGVCDDLELYRMKFRFGDTLTVEACIHGSDAYFIKDVMAVYRVHGGGVTAGVGMNWVMLDAVIVNIWRLVRIFGFTFGDAVGYYGNELYSRWFSLIKNGARSYSELEQVIRGNKAARAVFLRLPNRVFSWTLRSGAVKNDFLMRNILRLKFKVFDRIDRRRKIGMLKKYGLFADDCILKPIQ